MPACNCLPGRNLRKAEGGRPRLPAPSPEVKTSREFVYSYSGRRTILIDGTTPKPVEVSVA
ncbi:MAG: hypothetical protein DWQ34_25785 [Planctomycetota bacterium]|nr:MAG: hypothetical protein DWQ34_25785 [Planctomycetota bacterium]REK29737.1 MAG: hypothetical protein DWQ41_03620 [Planctomycetota bacterium]REK30441.1 MAG: hypothetical protein DWQ45_21415 [Planctomycetota bacterium]